MTAVLRPAALACVTSGLWWLRAVQGSSNVVGGGAAGSSPGSTGFAPATSGASAGASAFFLAAFFGFGGTSSGSTRPVITSRPRALEGNDASSDAHVLRPVLRAAMRASSFSCFAFRSSLRAYAVPCSAGSIGGLSVMSCISSASSSRRFRSAAVGVPGRPGSLCSVWIRSQSGSRWISTHFHRFASRSAVFFSSASASLTPPSLPRPGPAVPVGAAFGVRRRAGGPWDVVDGRGARPGRPQGPQPPSEPRGKPACHLFHVAVITYGALPKIVQRRVRSRFPVRSISVVSVVSVDISRRRKLRVLNDLRHIT